jgi:hypothetical protein
MGLFEGPGEGWSDLKIWRMGEAGSAGSIGGVKILGMAVG